MKNYIKELKKQGIECYENYNVKHMTSYKIGGIADGYVVVKDMAELIYVLRVLKKNRKKFMAVGRWSNLLVSDAKINMVFVSLKGDFEKVNITEDTAYAGAGIKMHELLEQLARYELSGLEFTAGIPGSLGGAVYMNAGIRSKSMADVIDCVYAMDRLGKLKKIENKKCKFSYRHSIFRDNNDIIVGAEFKGLVKRDRYEMLSEIKTRIDNRKKKHPLNYPSAGSVFKNGKNYSSGEMIDKAGLKGISIGGARVSEKHANFIINAHNATFDDVSKLIKKVKAEVKKKLKIKLEEEIIYIK